MKEKIALIVDDEKLLLDLVSNFFSERGFKTITAADGKEAMEKVRKRKFDVIICDLMMPNMNGIAFINEIRKERESYEEISDNRFTPIIVISGNLEHFSSDMALIHDISILEKPFFVKDLERIAKVVGLGRNIKRMTGDSPENTYGDALISLIEYLNILCKERVRILLTRESQGLFEIKNAVVIKYLFEVNFKLHSFYFSIPEVFARFASNALLGQEIHSQISEELMLKMMGNFSTNVVDKILKSYERRSLKVTPIDMTIGYEFENGCNLLTSEKREYFTSTISTMYSNIQFIGSKVYD